MFARTNLYNSARVFSRKMHIVSLAYQKPISEVDKFLEEHKQFLMKCYSKGYFIASGRKNPRMGGIIISVVESKAKLEEILKHDPFFKYGIAQYEITEFSPSMYSKEFSSIASLDGKSTPEVGLF